MKGDYYECSTCPYKTSRSANANRHIKTVHAENALAYAYNKRRNKFSKIVKISIADISELQEEEIYIQKIIKKINKPLDDLERLYQEFPTELKAFPLLNIIMKSLESSNPDKAIYNAIENARADIVISRIARYMSYTTKRPVNESENILKEKIKLCPARFSTIS